MAAPFFWRGGAHQRLRSGPALLDRQGDVRAALPAAAVAREVRRQGRHRRARQPRRRRRRRPAPRPGDAGLRGRHDRRSRASGSACAASPRAAPSPAPSGSAWRWSLRRGYVAAITDSLHQYRLDVERAATASMDRSASTVLAKAFDAGDPDAILYVLRAFAQSGRRPPLDAVRALLTHEHARGPGPGAGGAARRPRPDDPRRGRAAAARSRHRGADRGAAVAGVPRPRRSAGADRRPRRFRGLLDPRQHGRALQPARPLPEPRSGARAARRRWRASAARGPPRPHRGGDAARAPVRRGRRRAGRPGER